MGGVIEIDDDDFGGLFRRTKAKGKVIAQMEQFLAQPVIEE
jgi:hypothetical protein